MNLITLLNRCLGIACLIVLVVQVMLLNMISKTGQEISKLETQVETLKVQNQQLTNELSQLQNLDRIALRATELGLKPSTSALTLNGLPPIAMSKQ